MKAKKVFLLILIQVLVLAVYATVNYFALKIEAVVLNPLMYLIPFGILLLLADIIIMILIFRPLAKPSEKTDSKESVPLYQDFKPSVADKESANAIPSSNQNTDANQLPKTTQQQASVVSPQQMPRTVQQQAPVISPQQMPRTPQQQAPTISPQQMPRTPQQQAPVISPQQMPRTPQQQAPVISPQQMPKTAQQQAQSGSGIIFSDGINPQNSVQVQEHAAPQVIFSSGINTGTRPQENPEATDHQTPPVIYSQNMKSDITSEISTNEVK